jgi:hypothetical protein
MSLDRHSLDEFRERLLGLRKRTASGQYFIPFLSLTTLFTQSLVAKAVAEFCSYEHRRPAVTSAIREKGLRVFAILVLLHQEELMLDFLEHNLLDSNLPMEQSQVLTVSVRISPRFCSDTQWELIAYSFERTSLHQRLRREIVLPFEEEEKFDEGSGGDIFKCVIFEGHQQLLPVGD